MSGSVRISAAGGGDVEVGFYSVSATVKLVSCVNATVHINQSKYTEDHGSSSILFDLHSGGRGLHQLGRMGFISGYTYKFCGFSFRAILAKFWQL